MTFLLVTVYGNGILLLILHLGSYPMMVAQGESKPTMQCEHLSNSICRLASDIAQCDCPVLVEQCIYCTEKANPSQSINVVTISLAIKYTDNKDRVIASYSSIVSSVPKPSKEGPGTELKKLISWFVWDKKVDGCKICKTREQRMNNWGPDTCLKNIQTIVAWLRESAKKKGYPFSERVAAALIRRAIANSRR